MVVLPSGLKLCVNSENQLGKMLDQSDWSSDPQMLLCSELWLAKHLTSHLLESLRVGPVSYETTRRWKQHICHSEDGRRGPLREIAIDVNRVLMLVLMTSEARLNWSFTQLPQYFLYPTAYTFLEQIIIMLVLLLVFYIVG